MKKPYLPETILLWKDDDTTFLVKYDYEQEQAQTYNDPGHGAYAEITEVCFDGRTWYDPSEFFEVDEMEKYNAALLDKIIQLEIEHFEACMESLRED